MAIMCLSLLLTAGAAPAGEIALVATKPDGQGYFNLEIRAKNVTFTALQMALRFDPAVLAPVDGAGADTDEFPRFASHKPYLSTLGCRVDKSSGFVGFTAYLAPGDTGEAVQNGQIVLEDAPATLLTLRFRRLRPEDPGLALATAAIGTPYEASLPQGFAMMDENGIASAVLRFDLSALNAVSPAPVTVPAGTGEAEESAKELLQKSLILKLGSHAAVSEGGVVAFYPGEREIVPYLDQNGRTMVPLRFIGERLGAKVTWQAENQSVVITMGETRVCMTVGKKEYTVNGQTRNMDTVPVLMKSKEGARTMVPIRFVAEAFGRSVGWNAKQKMVVIAPQDYLWVDDKSLEQSVWNEAARLMLLYGSFV